MPTRVRALYGLAWSPAQQRTYRAMTAAMRASAAITPARLRQGSNERFFGLVERTEQLRVGRGEQTWRVSA